MRVAARVVLRWGDTPVFQTFAVLSTLGCLAVFIAMYRMERHSRRDEETGDSRRR